ncbi:hypothetical protein SAMN05443245_0849 [Paraburkholderia fungorum]|uniref:Uncharacterized protein n=1 Tax=Paraburkholderia fungorum TaxID=134537 RepID=A0A1H0ZUB2_9BURK|nr:hypothetical protein [Paraburkholderia fungorum]SDQ30932.1 hypothetical protein SAMN05443245_0849 [Paraburkholderia fungorum]
MPGGEGVKTRRQAIKSFLLGGLAGAGAAIADTRLVSASTNAPGGRNALTGANAAPVMTDHLSGSDALSIARDGVAHDVKIQRVAAYVQGHPFPDPAAPSYLKTLSDIVAGQEISVARFVDPRRFAAIQSGTSDYDCGDDLRAALQSGARGLYLPRGIWRYKGDLITAVGQRLRGDGGGEYVVITGVESGATVLERQDAGKGATAAALNLNESATVEHIQVRPAHHALVIYHMANYPARTGNTPIGIHMKTASSARHCTVIGFPRSGFELGTVATLERCYAYMCDRGFYSNTMTDGSLINCIGMFCHTAGADLVDNFWQVIGGRWEWNARHGVIMGAESVVTGAVFDRNGFAGLCMQSGHWGKTVTGNYFSRNGCGGNGSLGRWNFSKPGHVSYLDVPPGRSCQIQIDYQQGATIVGNRFRPGKDDSNDGCDGPQYVYGSTTPSGSTPLNGIVIHSNHGDRAGDSIPGFNKDYPGGGAIAGGKDADLVHRMNLGVGFEQGGVASPLHCGDQTVSGAVAQTQINVLRRSSGRVMVRAVTEAHASLAEILFATNGTDSGYKTVVNNLLGNAVKSAVLSANPSEDRYNRIDIALNEPCFVSYSVFST